MAEKEEYNSIYDGPAIDAAVTQAKPGGTLDSRLRLSLYTSLEQIGITVGSETMEAVALALPNNAILETSCGSSNNGVTNGTGFPVISGSVLKYGILRVSRIGGYDRVSFEFRVQEPASRLFVGFYSSTNGWSGWKKVYTEGSKPTASEVGALPVSGGNVNGPVNATRFAQSDYQYALEIGHYIDMHLSGSAADYDGRISLDSDKKLLFNGFAIYHTGNKPTPSELGIGDTPQIAVGSYKGTGGATSGSAPTLTFPFTPKVVLVIAMAGDATGDIGYFLNGIGAVISHVTNSIAEYVIPTVAWGNNSLHYYTTNSYGPIYALNVSRATYGYIAFV